MREEIGLLSRNATKKSFVNVGTQVPHNPLPSIPSQHSNFPDFLHNPMPSSLSPPAPAHPLSDKPFLPTDPSLPPSPPPSSSKRLEIVYDFVKRSESVAKLKNEMLNLMDGMTALVDHYSVIFNEPVGLAQIPIGSPSADSPLTVSQPVVMPTAPGAAAAAPKKYNKPSVVSIEKFLSFILQKIYSPIPTPTDSESREK